MNTCPFCGEVEIRRYQNGVRFACGATAWANGEQIQGMICRRICSERDKRIAAEARLAVIKNALSSVSGEPSWADLAMCVNHIAQALSTTKEK